MEWQCKRLLQGLAAGWLATASVSMAGCDRTPTEPDRPIPESAVERLEAKRGPKGAGPKWVVRDLGSLPGDRDASAAAVNDAGWAVGLSEVSSGTGRGFLTDGVSLLPLSEAGVYSSARTVSNSYPLFIGGWVDDPGVGGRPVRWTVSMSGGRPEATYEFVSETCGNVRGINDAGDMVGSDGMPFGLPMIWHATGQKTEVTFPPGDAFETGTGRDINNAGLVVLSFYGQDYDRGFLRLTDGSLIELPPRSGDVSSYAAAISEVIDDSVFVAGTSWQSDYSYHPVRWTVNATSGAILSTRVMEENGSSGSTSLAGEVAGCMERRWQDKPAIWYDTGPVQLPLPKGTSGGCASVSPNGRFAAGAGYREQGTRALLWARSE